MAMKEQQRQVYRSMQGKVVDLNKLIQANELTPAVGNAGVNAVLLKIPSNVLLEYNFVITFVLFKLSSRVSTTKPL